MKEYTHQFPITKMSQVFKVSRSGYYKWLNTPPSPRSQYNQGLREAIKQEWEDSQKRYGSPRIHQELVAKGWKVSRPRVARLMRAMGIASRIRRKWVKTTDSSHSLPVAPNLLDRGFFPSQLGQVWVSDITYLPSREGWLYLTTVMDLADRQIIGWSLSQSLHTEATSKAALHQALIKHPQGCELFHSDRGVQYASAQARMVLFEFIEIWYNRKRRHSALNYLTPVQAEENLNHEHATGVS